MNYTYNICIVEAFSLKELSYLTSYFNVWANEVLYYLNRFL